MNNQYVAAPVVLATDGPSISNTTTETALVPVEIQKVLNGGYWYPGKKVRVTMRGRLSNIVTTPGTLTFRLRWGSVASGVIMAASQALQLNTTANTTVTFELELELTCRVAGSASNFMLLGRASSLALGTSATFAVVMIPASTPAVGSNVDTSGSNFILPTAQFSIANAGNLIQLHGCTIEDLN